MKKCGIWLISLLGLVQVGYGQTNSKGTSGKDSVVVNFGNKTRMIIVSEEKGGIKDLQKYDFNAILKDVGIFTENAKNKETVLFINDATGKRYLKDTTLVVQERNKDERVAESQADSTLTNRDENEDYDDDDWEDDHHTNNNHVEFSMDLGFNTFLEGGKIPSRYDAPYGLRPLGSRYVAFSVLSNQQVGGEKSPFYLRWGLEVAWNNFMFEGNNYAVQIKEGVTFPEYINEKGNLMDLDKSKLTVCYLSIPVVPTLQFHNKHGRRTFRLGAGGYAGLRLASYSKVKYKDGDNSVKRFEHGNFFLNDFRYGLMAQVGIKGLLVFAKYDLNPLFSDSKGPALNTLSFGLTLFNL
jgi:hypothetical protein